MSTETITEPLPDGSTVTVESCLAMGHPQHMVSRFVDGVCVWGQVFAGDQADNICAAVLADMRVAPGSYRRWWLA